MTPLHSLNTAVVAASPALRRRACRARPTIPGSRRRRAGARAVGCGVFLFLTLMVASTSASLFKRRAKGAHSGSSGKRRVGGREKVKEDVAWLLEDTSDGGWTLVRDDGHVKVWKRSMPGSDFVAIKSSATLSVSPQALFEVLTPGDIEIVRRYNPLVEDGSDLEVIDRDNKVSWSATMGIWPCRPRDFVTHIRRATLDDGSVAIVNSATTHPKAPERGQYVRGEILHGVFHIKAAKNKEHSEFTMVHHFNPGGSVPAWLMNWLAEGKPMTFVRRLEEVARKWDKRAAATKNMPCKGRGFADKPCDFLLDTADGSEQGDATTPGGAWGKGSVRGWLTLLAGLTTAALAFYGRAVLHGLPRTDEKQGEPRPLAEEKRPSGQNRPSAAVDVARTSPAKSAGCEATAPEMFGQENTVREVVNGDSTTGEMAGGGVSKRDGEVFNEDGEVQPKGEVVTAEVVCDNASDEKVPHQETTMETGVNKRVTSGEVTTDEVVVGEVPVGGVCNGKLVGGGAPDVEGTNGEGFNSDMATADVSSDEVVDEEASNQDSLNEKVSNVEVSSGELVDGEVSIEEVTDQELVGVKVPRGVDTSEELVDGEVAGIELVGAEVPSGEGTKEGFVAGTVYIEEVADKELVGGEVPSGDSTSEGLVAEEVPSGEEASNGEASDEVAANGNVASETTRPTKGER